MILKTCKQAKSLPHGTVTQNFGLRFGVGGSQTSADNYTSYTISVHNCFYVYRHKPKWFGQYDGDRYLGRLRWVSRHADGKQWKNIWWDAPVSGTKVAMSNRDETTKLVYNHLLTLGYVQAWQPDQDFRERHKKSNYHLGIKCAHCGTLDKHMQDKVWKVKWDLQFPKNLYAQHMDRWDAHDKAKQIVVCKCGG